MIEKGGQVLVQIREKKDWPGITFPGGKVEVNESIYDSTIREVKEETGLIVSNLKHCGIVHYNVNDEAEKWVIFLFKTSTFQGEMLDRSEEGKVFWMDKKDLSKAQLSNDLEYYLEIYEDDSLFEGYAKWNGSTSSDFKIF